MTYGTHTDHEPQHLAAHVCGEHFLRLVVLSGVYERRSTATAFLHL